MEPKTPKFENTGKHDPIIKGSVAHHIIGQFVETLAEKKDFEEMAKNLKEAVFKTKFSEDELRKAIFGEDPL